MRNIPAIGSVGGGIKASRKMTAKNLAAKKSEAARPLEHFAPLILPVSH